MEFLRRYWPLFSIVALIVGLALLSPHQTQYDPTNPYAYQKATQQITNWDWTLTAAISAAAFTGVLAIIGMVQVYDAQKSSERQLRAYVFPRAKMLHDFEIGKKPWVEIDIKNFGQTPAYKFQQGAKTQMVFLNVDLPDIDNTEARTIPLAPSDFIQVHAKSADTIVPELMSLIQQDTIALMVVGRIDFMDAFGKPRWVKYCFRSLMKDGKVGVVLFERGNCTSEDVAC